MCVSANVEIILPRLAPPVKPFFVPFPLESGVFPLLALPPLREEIPSPLQAVFPLVFPLFSDV